MWAISGIYLSVPSAFNVAVDYPEPVNVSGRRLRLGDQVLYWLAQAHFGRFAGVSVKIAWTILGLAPAALFLTGLLMWWTCVLKPWMARSEIVASSPRDLEISRENSPHAQR